MPDGRPDLRREQLQSLERRVASSGKELALFLAYDRPERVDELPELARLSFAERCVPDAQLQAMREAFESVGAHVELFAGDLPLLKAFADGRITGVDRRLQIIYNGLEGGVTHGAFQPGRLALVPAVADTYRVVCANSDAHACAIGRHKFHYFTLLHALGLPVPRVWHYRLNGGWALGAEPPPGTRVIVKSTYESWSVGVTDRSIFVVDSSSEKQVRAIAEQLGQAVTVQEFVAGHEVCVPILAYPEPVVMPPVKIERARAPEALDAVTTIRDNLRTGGVAHLPYDGPPSSMDQLRSVALSTFDALDLTSFARVDFRVDAAGKTWVTDVATSPGISARSSAFRSLEGMGLDYPGFLRVVSGRDHGVSWSPLVFAPDLDPGGPKAPPEVLPNRLGDACIFIE